MATWRPTPDGRRAPRAHRSVAALAALLALGHAAAAPPPDGAIGADPPLLHQLVDEVEAAPLQASVRRLVDFGTRSTLSDTQSDTRGIGAARRWVQRRFEEISAQCQHCLQVLTPSQVYSGERLPTPTAVVDVVAVQRGSAEPGRVVLITAHVDSRNTNVLDAIGAAPGADDDASGTAAVLEAARVLSHHRLRATVVYGVLSGEEQGLYGGRVLAEYAKAQGWQVEADLNNDIIGNIQGQDGVVDNSTVRIFSEGTRALETPAQADERRYHGGEVDAPSRNVARYVQDLAEKYLPNLHVRLVYRTDRYGRGGDQVEFLKQGYPAIRLTEGHENYTRQHQDVRIEKGVAYGDTVEGVDAAYLAQVTRLNVVTLAALANAPAPPSPASVAGAVSADTTLKWTPVAGAAGYRGWWRDTTAPRWQHSRLVTEATASSVVLESIVVDDWFFGVSALSSDGYESPVVFAGPAGAF